MSRHNPNQSNNKKIDSELNKQASPSLSLPTSRIAEKEASVAETKIQLKRLASGLGSQLGTKSTQSALATNLQMECRLLGATPSIEVSSGSGVKSSNDSLKLAASYLKSLIEKS